MNQIPSPAYERADRIRTEQLRLLYHGVFAVPTNLVVALVVIYLLRNTFPPLLLGLWLLATAVTAALRIRLNAGFARAIAMGPGDTKWAFYFCLGSFASGGLWGLLCVCLPIWGTANQFLLLTLVCSGMTAGALTTIGAYLPAYLAYAASFIVPLTIVSLINPNPDIAANGMLGVVYMIMIGFAAKKLSQTIGGTIELRIDNEDLQTSLEEVRIERDTARTEKWSTLAQLSHELRTPLNAILGFSETMRDELFGPLGSDRYRQYATHVYTSGEHLLTLTGEILQLSQGESGTLALHETDVDLANVLRHCLNVVAPSAEKGGLTLTTTVEPSLPQLRADATKTLQMLLNLANNAVKFTRPGGSISIAVSRSPSGGIDIVVRDSGIGMKADEIALALQPFGRVANPLNHNIAGMGLGLPICRRLAEMHGAQLTIESEPGKGTTCRISFPASRCAWPPGARSKESGELATVAA
jgi:two-component system, cell cycle sensor histidine kinase PleC